MTDPHAGVGRRGEDKGFVEAASALGEEEEPCHGDLGDGHRRVDIVGPC